MREMLTVWEGQMQQLATAMFLLAIAILLGWALEEITERL